MDGVVFELVVVVDFDPSASVLFDCDTDDSVVGAERDDRMTGPSLPIVMMSGSDWDMTS